MIFSIRDLSFELGSLLLEGWLALAARAVCALLILLAAWLVRRWLNKKGIPALLARSWYFTGTPILLRSFSTPILRMCSVIGVYLAAASLPWAISGIPKLLLLCFRLAMTLLVCEGLYAASDLADLLLASCSPEIRSNKTLRSLLDTTYKVLVIVLCVAALAQEVGFPIGSIVAGAGLVGLTISLAAQESASNLFSGIVILLDKPFSVGDWITVGSVEGEVIDINFRSTRIRSLDKTINIVTNSQICASTVKNAALRTMRPYKFNLGGTYNTTRPKLEKLMATIRSREISACLVLQAQSQLKAIYKDNADTIVGNCDSMIFLGGKERTTLKELAETLGRETIDTYNTGESRGKETSHSLNYQKLGKELMSVDELAVLDGRKCILQLRGVRPFLSDKYDITKHPYYKYLSDADPRNAFHIDHFLSCRMKPKADESYHVFETSVDEDETAAETDDPDPTDEDFIFDPYAAY